MRLSWIIATRKINWKKIVLHPRTTLARPPIYDQALPEKLSTVSPDNPVGIKKPSFFLVHSTWYKCLGTVDTGKGNLPFDNFRQQIHHKICSPSKPTSEGTALHIAWTIPHFKWYTYLLGMLNGQTAKGKKIFEKSFSCSKTFGQKSVKSRKISAKYCMKLTLPFYRLTIVRMS